MIAGGGLGNWEACAHHASMDKPKTAKHVDVDVDDI
jgi:hypothetical protein